MKKSLRTVCLPNISGRLLQNFWCLEVGLRLSCRLQDLFYSGSSLRKSLVSVIYSKSLFINDINDEINISATEDFNAGSLPKV